jgi:hypothetical protein
VCLIDKIIVGSLQDTILSYMSLGESFETALYSTRGVLDDEDCSFLLQLYKTMKANAKNCTSVNAL